MLAVHVWQGLQAGKVYCAVFAVSYSELNIKASGSRLRVACMSANNLSVIQDAAYAGCCCVWQGTYGEAL